METQLHAVINKAGTYDGMSSNYSGAGFSGMRFKFLGMTDGDFDKWVEMNRESNQDLSRDAYLKLEKPSEHEPVRRFAKVDSGLYEAALNRCVDGGKMCQHEMMAIDAAGGAGKGGVAGITQRAGNGVQQRSVVAALCTPDNPLGLPQRAPTGAAASN